MLPIICLPYNIESSKQSLAYMLAEDFNLGYISAGRLLQRICEFDPYVTFVRKTIEMKTGGELIPLEAFLTICKETFNEPETIYLGAYVQQYKAILGTVPSHIAIPLIEQSIIDDSCEIQKLHRDLELKIYYINKELEETDECFEERIQYIKDILEELENTKYKGIILEGFPQKLNHFNAAKNIYGVTKLIIHFDRPSEVSQGRDRKLAEALSNDELYEELVSYKEGPQDFMSEFEEHELLMAFPYDDSIPIDQTYELLKEELSANKNWRAFVNR